MQAEDGIRDLVRSRGLGDVYKRQGVGREEGAGRLDDGRLAPRALDDEIDASEHLAPASRLHHRHAVDAGHRELLMRVACLLYTSDAADERSSVDLGGRRIIKKKKRQNYSDTQ